MDPRQPSFIPRKSVTDTRLPSHAYLGFFNLFCTSIFLVAILAAGAVFLYTRILESTVESRTKELASYQEQIKAPIVTELKKVSARLDAAEQRLLSHTALSIFFRELETITLRNIRWKTFKFEETGNAPSVTMEGEAKSFASVALQSDNLGQSPIFVNPLIANLNAQKNAQNGVSTAIFTLKAGLNPNIINYHNAVTAAIEEAKAKTQPSTTDVEPEVLESTSTNNISQ